MEPLPQPLAPAMENVGSLPAPAPSLPASPVSPVAAPLPLPRPGSRLHRWAKILSAYFSTQTATQLAGIGAGLIFIRVLPLREFALYTLAFSVITFVTFLSDLGSTSSLIHFFRLAAAEADSFQSYYGAVLSLRRLAFLVVTAGVAAGFPALAAAKGYAPAESLPITAAIVLCVWFQLNSSLRILALRLADAYGRSYRAELAGGLARLLLAVVIAAGRLLHAWLAVLTSAVAAALTTRLARPPLTATAAPAPLDRERYRRRVLRYLLPTLPSAVYFATQGPLTVWLSATFGSMRTVAEVGALGRLGLVVGLFSGLSGVIFLPRLARLGDDRLYRRRYLQFGAFLVAIAATLLAAAALLPRAFLLVLGPQYRGLHRELLLVVAASGFTLLDGYTLGINSARSWNRWQAPALAFLVVCQALFIAFLPLGTTWNVLLFNLLTAVIGWLSQATFNLLGFVRPRWVRWA
jgi:O-antigen/teichoic acid export membrane protein